MKVHLIIPNLVGGKYFLQPPLCMGLSYAHLAAHGHQPRLIDNRIARYTIPELVEAIEGDTQAIVVCTAPYDMMQMYHFDYRLTYTNDTVNALKQAYPHIPIILTGAHGNVRPDLMFRDSQADYIIQGEVERILPLVADGLTRSTITSVPNILYRNGTGFTATPKNSQLAQPNLQQGYLLPNYAGLDFDRYFGYELHGDRYERLNRWGVLQGSRGCPYHCDFCYNFWGNKVRYRTVESVADEFELLERTYQVKCLFFLDSIFTLNRRWARAVCHELVRRGLSTPWVVQSRCDALDSETLDAMRAANCRYIYLGVESFNNEVLERVNKGTSEHVIEQAINRCHDHGITPCAFIIIGLPGETPSTLQKTIEFLAKYHIPYTPIVSTPRFGSTYSSLLGAQETLDWEDLAEARGRTQNTLSLDHVVGTVRELRKQNVLSTQPLPVANHTKEQPMPRTSTLSPVPARDYIEYLPEEKRTRAMLPYLTFALTKTCFFKCLYCGEGGELSTSTQDRFRMADVIDMTTIALRHGISKFRLTGGEPFTHPDIGDIMRFFVDQKAYLLVNTNGALVSRKKDALVGLNDHAHFAVSLDSLDETNFNRISRTQHHFANTLAGVELLAKLGLLLRINMVVSRYNIDELPNMIAFCKEVGCGLKLQEIVSVPVPFSTRDDVHVALDGVEEQLEQQAERVELHEYAKGFGIPCKIYVVDGVRVTVKSLSHGSRYDHSGACGQCPYYPCHEGLYDIYALPDGNIVGCRWTQSNNWATFEDQLVNAIQSFQNAVWFNPGGHLPSMPPLQLTHSS